MKKSKLSVFFKNQLNRLQNIYKKVLSYKICCSIYLILIIVILVITIMNHKKQNKQHLENLPNKPNIETFANREFKNKHVVYSKCKKECVVKHEDPDKAKACKKYCKCKKNCAISLNKKKCLKGCKDLKMNRYRDDEVKYQKMKLKQELKAQNKKDRKEQKIEARREEIAKQKEIQKEKENSKTGSFLINVMNKYASENDREFLLNLSSSSHRLYKDFSNAFRIR